MKLKTALTFLLAGIITCSFPLMANDVTDAHIAGHVLDAHTGEHLPFVNVTIEGTTMGCLTDDSGHFYLKNLPEGKHTVIFSMMGYETEKRTVTLRRDTLMEINVSIAEKSFVIDNVVVTANKYETKQEKRLPPSSMSFRPSSFSPPPPTPWQMY